MDELFFILIVIGIFASFIGTLAGGGGLITLPAMMLVGIPIQVGIATNKFSASMAALTSVSYLLRSKQLKGKTIIRNVSIAFVGGITGALITSSLSEQQMNMIAFILLLVAFVITVKNKEWTTSMEGKSREENEKKSVLMPYFIAVYDGGFGPGSSTFSIIHYIGKRNTYVKAVQLTRVLILGSGFGAFIVFYNTGFVQWNYAIAMAIGSAIGSQIGLLALPRIPMKLAKNLLMVILILLIGQMVYKMI